MTFAGVAVAPTCCSLTVRLDMVGSVAAIDTGLYAGNRVSVTVKHAIGLIHRAYRGHKKASRVAPTRHARILPGPGRETPRLGRRHQHGIDHMDHAVRLVDVRDRDHRGAALGVDDPDLAALVLHG